MSDTIHYLNDELNAVEAQSEAMDYTTEPTSGPAINATVSGAIMDVLNLFICATHAETTKDEVDLQVALSKAWKVAYRIRKERQVVEALAEQCSVPVIAPDVQCQVCRAPVVSTDCTCTI